MALTADNSGRITSQPTASGNPPPAIAAIFAQSMASSGGGSASQVGPAVALNIRLGQDQSKQVRLEGKGWMTQGNTGARAFSSIDEAVNSFFMMDDKYRANVMEKLYYYGLTDGPNNEAQAASAWSDAVKMAWNYKIAGKDVDPIDLLPRMTNLKAGQLGGGPRTVTQRSFNALDPEAAKAFIRQSFQASMGRDPHDAEIRNLLRGLSAGFQNGPSVTQQTTDSEGNSTQRVLDPGFDQSAYIQNRMTSDPEAAAYQAAAELYPALQQALQSPV